MYNTSKMYKAIKSTSAFCILHTWGFECPMNVCPHDEMLLTWGWVGEKIFSQWRYIQHKKISQTTAHAWYTYKYISDSIKDGIGKKKTTNKQKEKIKRSLVVHKGRTLLLFLTPHTSNFIFI